MEFPGADSPPISFFSASTVSLFILIDSSPQLALVFGVASMGFPGADPPQFSLFSAPTVVLGILLSDTSLSLCSQDRGGRRCKSLSGSQNRGGWRGKNSPGSHSQSVGMMSDSAAGGSGNVGLWDPVCVGHVQFVYVAFQVLP